MTKRDQRTAAEYPAPDWVALGRFWTAALVRLEAYLDSERHATGAPPPTEGASHG